MQLDLQTQRVICTRTLFFLSKYEMKLLFALMPHLKWIQLENLNQIFTFRCIFHWKVYNKIDKNVFIAAESKLHR